MNEPMASITSPQSSDTASEIDAGNHEGALMENKGFLFAGDHGTLPFDTRKALVNLLLGTVEAEYSPAIWKILIRDVEIIRQRLGDLFLDLVFDRDRGVAFIRQVEAPDLDFPILLRSAPLTFLDSALLIVLREQLMRADNIDERAVVTREELIEHLDLYRKSSVVDESRFRQKCNKSIEKMKDRNLLRQRRHGLEGWEISPMLRHLFKTETVIALADKYRELAVLSEDNASNSEADVEEPEEDGI